MPRSDSARPSSADDALLCMDACRWEAGVHPRGGQLCPPVPSALSDAYGNGASWWDAVFPDDLSRVRRGLADARVGQMGAPVEYRLVVGSAGIVWVRHWMQRRRLPGAEARARGWSGVVVVIDEQRRLAGECLRICEHERQAVGQELHDDIGQVLAGMSALLHGIAGRVRKSDRGLGGEIDAVLRELRVGMSRTRAVAHGLVVLKVAERGLTGAMKTLAAQTAVRFGVKVAVRCSSPRRGVDPADVGELYRIAQEAIGNAVTHGGASRVTIRGSSRGAAWSRLTIRDNGSGIRRTALRREGLGLRLMAHRARVLGGTLAIAPGAARGTVVTVDYPVRTVAPARRRKIGFMGFGGTRRGRSGRAGAGRGGQKL